MKLLRYGQTGAEKPGMIDADGALRDLSAHVTDIAHDALSPQSLARLGALPLTIPHLSYRLDNAKTLCYALCGWYQSKSL